MRLAPPAARPLIRPAARTAAVGAALAAVVLAACGNKSDASATGDARGGQPTAAGADSGTDSVVMNSVPPTAQDSSVAVPRTGAATDTNTSGMAVPSGGAPVKTP